MCTRREHGLQSINHGRTLYRLAPVGALIPQRDLDLLIALARLQEQTYISRKRFAALAAHGNVPHGKGPRTASQGQLQTHHDHADALHVA
jgi:hypothetical protein